MKLASLMSEANVIAVYRGSAGALGKKNKQTKKTNPCEALLR